MVTLETWLKICLYILLQHACGSHTSHCPLAFPQPLLGRDTGLMWSAPRPVWRLAISRLPSASLFGSALSGRDPSATNPIHPPLRLRSETPTDHPSSSCCLGDPKYLSRSPRPWESSNFTKSLLLKTAQCSYINKYNPPWEQSPGKSRDAGDKPQHNKDNVPQAHGQHPAGLEKQYFRQNEEQDMDTYSPLLYNIALEVLARAVKSSEGDKQEKKSNHHYIKTRCYI